MDTEKELSERYAAQLKLYEEALNRVYENEKDAAGNPLKVKEKLVVFLPAWESDPGIEI